MSCYCNAKDVWTGLQPYNTVGPKSLAKRVIKEEYTPLVTLSLHEWRDYISSGNHIILGSGGVIPGGRIQTAFGGKGPLKGHVRQGYGGCGMGR